MPDTPTDAQIRAGLLEFDLLCEDCAHDCFCEKGTECVGHKCYSCGETAYRVQPLTGYRWYPFRLTCHNARNDGGQWCLDIADHICILCKGLSYIFNDSPDVLFAAVMAHGGTLRAWINQKDGQLYAECRLGSPKNQPQITTADQIMPALRLALWRAWQATKETEGN